MKTTNIIKGKPVYLYKHSQYVYQPNKTDIKKMKYDEESNTTYVYCSRPTIIPEIFLIGIMVSLVIINIAYIHKEEIKVYYNEYTIWHNGVLYLNLTSDIENNYEIYYYLFDSGGNEVTSGLLNPGDSVITVDTINPSSEYLIRVTYKTLLKERDCSFRIYTENKDVKSEEE